MNNYELVFLDFDNMENTHGNARYTRRVPLRAADDVVSWMLKDAERYEELAKR